MRAKNLEPDRSLNCLTREIPKQKEFFLGVRKSEYPNKADYNDNFKKY